MKNNNSALSIGQKSKFSAIALSAVAMASLMLGSANAAIIITFTEAVGGGFTVTATGSGNVSATKTDDDWDQKNFATNFLSSSFSDEDADSVSGTLTNVTQTVSVAIDKFEIDSDGTGSTDDIAFKNPGDIAFTSGDEFELDFTATYVGIALFSDLIVGTHTLTTNQSTDSDEIFGDITLNVVAIPEPSSIVMVGLAGLGLIVRRRR